MKLSEIIKNEYVELEFDNRVKINAVANVPITITEFTSMNTQYGHKDIAIFKGKKRGKDIEGWFYLTNTLDHLLEYCPPFDVTITSRKSKNGNEYWSSDLVPTSDKISIKDLVGEEIRLLDIKQVETKYGNQYVITFPTEDGDMNAFTSWEYLYNDILDKANELMMPIPELLEQDELWLKVIEKKSKKSNRVYIYYTDVED